MPPLFGEYRKQGFYCKHPGSVSIYENLGIAKKNCAVTVDSVFEIIKQEMDRGHDIMISGFGKWSIKSKRARRGRNPQTGESIMIKARKVLTFKPSQILRKTVNGK